jgi:hypothetical protein
MAEIDDSACILLSLWNEMGLICAEKDILFGKAGHINCN